LSWLREDGATDPASLPSPAEIAASIAEDLETALARLRAVAASRLRAFALPALVSAETSGRHRHIRNSRRPNLLMRSIDRRWCRTCPAFDVG